MALDLVALPFLFFDGEVSGDGVGVVFAFFNIDETSTSLLRLLDEERSALLSSPALVLAWLPNIFDTESIDWIRECSAKHNRWRIDLVSMLGFVVWSRLGLLPAKENRAENRCYDIVRSYLKQFIYV